MTELLIRWAVLAAFVAAACAFTGWKVYDHEHAKLEVAEQKHAVFVTSVEATGRAQATAAAKQAERDRKNKERNDEENLQRHAALERDIARLRADARARDSRGGSVPANPAGSGCPDGQTCFDTAEYQRAVGDFDSEARRLADEGTSVTVDLDTAKAWARKP